MQPLPWGWRFATTDEWNAFLAVWDVTQWFGKCANPHFPDSYAQKEEFRTWCATADLLTWRITNVEKFSYRYNYDLFLVHDFIDSCPRSVPFFFHPLHHRTLWTYTQVRMRPPQPQFEHFGHFGDLLKSVRNRYVCVLICESSTLFVNFL